MKYTQNKWICHFCVTIFPSYDRSIEGGALCKLRSALLVAAGGILYFGMLLLLLLLLLLLVYSALRSRVGRRRPSLGPALHQYDLLRVRECTFCGTSNRRSAGILVSLRKLLNADTTNVATKMLLGVFHEETPVCVFHRVL